MGIFAALAFFLPLVALAGIWEMIAATVKRVQEKRSWKAVRAIYYPKCF